MQFEKIKESIERIKENEMGLLDKILGSKSTKDVLMAAVIADHIMKCKEGCDTDEIPEGYGEFGLTVTNPVPVCGIDSNDKYLGMLRTESDETITWKRVGSMSADNINNPIDVYQILNSDEVQSSTIYISSYHKRISHKAPQGFKLVETTEEVSVDIDLTEANRCEMSNRDCVDGENHQKLPPQISISNQSSSISTETGQSEPHKVLVDVASGNSNNVNKAVSRRNKTIGYSLLGIVLVYIIISVFIAIKPKNTIASNDSWKSSNSYSSHQIISHVPTSKRIVGHWRDIDDGHELFFQPIDSSLKVGTYRLMNRNSSPSRPIRFTILIDAPNSMMVNEYKKLPGGVASYLETSSNVTTMCTYKISDDGKRMTKDSIFMGSPMLSVYRYVDNRISP